MADEILQAIESLKTELSERLATLEQRFAKFEIRFDAMDRRLQAFELRFDAMDTRLLHDFQSVNSGFRRLNGKTEVIAAIEAELQTRRDADLLTREELLDLKRRVARIEKRLDGS
jgi:chromosome segregation ATPase